MITGNTSTEGEISERHERKANKTDTNEPGTCLSFQHTGRLRQEAHHVGVLPRQQDPSENKK